MIWIVGWLILWLLIVLPVDIRLSRTGGPVPPLLTMGWIAAGVFLMEQNADLSVQIGQNLRDQPVGLVLIAAIVLIGFVFVLLSYRRLR